MPVAVREGELPELSPLVERRLLAGNMPSSRRDIALELTPRRLVLAGSLAAAIALVFVVLFATDGASTSGAEGDQQLARGGAGAESVDGYELTAISLAGTQLASAGNEIARYEWNIDDKNTFRSGREIVHGFSAPGAYTVTLTTTEAITGCATSCSLAVTVVSP